VKQPRKGGDAKDVGAKEVILHGGNRGGGKKKRRKKYSKPDIRMKSEKEHD